MCVCTPEKRTPYCGAPGCEWPTLTDELKGDEPEIAEEKQPELSLRFSIPKGVSIEEAKVFAQGLLSQIAAWHKEHEPGEESVDLTKEPGS